MSDKDELIWVEKDIADRIKATQTAVNRREEQLKIFNEYIDSLSERTRKEFRASMEGLDEDSQMFTGLMLRVKQTYEKTLNEQNTALWEVWENFEKEMPKEREKVQKMLDVLRPLLDMLKQVNTEIGKINTWNADKFLETLRALNQCSEKNQDMIKFLVQNYREGK